MGATRLASGIKAKAISCIDIASVSYTHLTLPTTLHV